MTWGRHLSFLECPFLGRAEAVGHNGLELKWADLAWSALAGWIAWRGRFLAHLGWAGVGSVDSCMALGITRTKNAWVAPSTLDTMIL